MDISYLARMGWVEFAAVLLAAGGLIASLAFGQNDKWIGRDGRERRGDRPTRLFVVGLAWLIVRLLVPGTALRTVPLALVVPGLDLSVLLAASALLFWALASSLRPEWTWRLGLRQFRFFLLPALMAFLVYEDAFAYPSQLWFLAAVEAALLLPFLIRLGYDEREFCRLDR